MYGKNIRYLRRKRGLKQDDISNLLGLKSFSTIQYWEVEKSQPNLGQLQQLASYFGYTIQDLVDRDLEVEESMLSTPITKKIPLLGKVAAGYPIFADDNIIDYLDCVHGGDFALTIKGDSMDPKIPNGSIVIVKQQNNLENGEIGIILIDNEDAVCKKIEKIDAGLMLTSLNSAYQPLFYSTKDIKKIPVLVIGKVIEVRIKI